MKAPRYMVVEKSCCGTCAHYRQHYTLTNQGKLHPLWYGHCGTPRMKNREPDEVCAYWKSLEPPDEGAIKGLPQNAADPKS